MSSARTSLRAVTRAGIDERAFAEALAETTESLVCVYDRAGTILLFNEACERATGFAREDVLGQDARTCVIPSEEVDDFAAVLAEVWSTGLPSPQVGHWLTKDGRRLLIAWSNRPVAGDGGAPAYLVTAGLDITERERSAAERRALEGDLEAKLAEVGRLAREQAALRRVATLVAAEVPPERVFESVSEEAARLLGTGAAGVLRYEGDGTATVVARFNDEQIDAFPLGSSVPLDKNSTIGRVHASGQPETIDDYGPIPGKTAEIIRRVGIRFTVAAPIKVAGAVWGAVAVTSITLDQPLPESEARLGDFCELASLAIASAQARDELRASRARIVHAADIERRRLERNLHDGAQQRLVSLSIALRLARRRLGSDPAAVEPLLESACSDVEEAIRELRELARGLQPVVLTERGLRPALAALAARTPIEVAVEAPDERLPESVEAAAYYIVSEALTNVVKHARAASGRVAVRRQNGYATIEVSDDGRGGAATDGGSGLVGLHDRVEALGGTLTLKSPPGQGTLLRALLPLA